MPAPSAHLSHHKHDSGTGKWQIDQHKLTHRLSRHPVALEYDHTDVINRMQDAAGISC